MQEELKQVVLVPICGSKEGLQLRQAQTVHFDQPDIQSYELWSQNLFNIVIWAPGHPGNTLMQVKKALAEVDPNLVIYGVEPYSRVIQGIFDQQNMIASLTWLFGAVGLVLAAVGLYGVTAYGVEQRRGEIGVRMALGADRRSVVAMVLRGALGQVGIGLGIGIPAAIGAGYLMASQLFGVKPWSPLLLAGATIFLGLAALCAAVIPARRSATSTRCRRCAANDPHGSNPDQLQAENGNSNGHCAGREASLGVLAGSMPVFRHETGLDKC